jgi:hypothetical protein
MTPPKLKSKFEPVTPDPHLRMLKKTSTINKTNPEMSELGEKSWEHISRFSSNGSISPPSEVSLEGDGHPKSWVRISKKSKGQQVELLDDDTLEDTFDSYDPVYRAGKINTSHHDSGMQ